MSKPYQKVIEYFSKLESKLGYDLILGGIKHFGYYPSGKSTISEKRAQELMQDLIAEKLKLTKGDIVLDAGCGQGNVAVYLSKKFGSNITGITVNPFEVTKANSLARKMHVEDKVDFKEMDYTKTSFPDQHFDAIYTSESLVHAYDLKKTLKEFRRLLKPNGRIVFLEYSMAKDEDIKKFEEKLKRYDNLIERYNWVIEVGAMFSLKFLRHNYLPKILKALNFANVNQENITKNVVLSMRRLYNLARFPYLIIKLLHLKNIFINTAVAAEFFPILIKHPEADLFRYNITFAQKP